MLDTWYFCNAVQIPLGQASNHIRMVAALRDGRIPELLVPDDLLVEALDQASGDGPWLQLHALAAALTVAADRSARPVSEAASGFCGHLLDSCLPDNERMRESLRGFLQRVIGGDTDDGLVTAVIALADEELAEPPAARPAAVPYLDLIDFDLPTIVLSILDAISRRDAGLVRECAAGLDRPVWFTRALDGRYGRQALLLSVETAARAGDRQAPAWLTRREAGVIDMEPDLLRCYARALHAGKNGPVAVRMEEYEIEAATGRSLPSPLGHGALAVARETVSLRITGQARTSSAFGFIMWQMFIWELAMEHDPADCAGRLRRWWGTPPDADEDPFNGSDQIRVMIPWDGDPAIRRRLQQLLQIRLHDQRLTAEFRAIGQRRRLARTGAAAVTEEERGQPSTNQPRLKLADGELRRTAHRIGAALFTPWAYRKSPNPGKDRIEPEESRQRTEFPGLVDPVAMIRVLAGTALAVRVLRAQPENGKPQFHLLGLMLHGKDVVTDSRFRPVQEAADSGTEPSPDSMALTQVPRSLSALVRYVDRIVDQAGKGAFDRISPDTLAPFVMYRAFGARRVGTWELAAQERHLFWQAAPGIAVKWIKEVFSGHIGQDGSSTGSRWFRQTESGISPALMLLERSVERERGERPRQAATMLLQINQDRFAEFQASKTGWDWYARKDKIQESFEGNVKSGKPERLVLNMSMLLCAPRYTAEQWQVAGPMVDAWLADPPGKPDDDAHQLARTVMLAVRLDAVLRDPGARLAPPYDQWLSVFLDRIRAIGSAQEFPRELRNLMIDWIPSGDPWSVPQPPADLAVQQDWYNLLATSIDAVTQFSLRTARYLVLLMDRLRETSLREGMANDQRYRLIHAVLQSHGRPDSRLTRYGPEGQLGAQRNARHVSSALARFLLDVAGNRLLQPDGTLGRAFLVLWHDLNVDPRVRARPASIGSPADQAAGAGGSTEHLNPGPWDMAVVIDRYRDLRIAYPIAVDTARAVIRGAEDEPVESLFAFTPRQRDLAAGDRMVLGVVAGKERDPYAGGDVVAFNCGTGTPVQVTVPAGEAPAVGELRAVRLSRESGAQPWTAYGYYPLAPARPQHGERRHAYVTELPEFPWLKVTVDGADVYSDEDSAAATLIRLAWDPDITRGLRMSDLSAGDGGAKEVLTPAYFDESLGWLPVDRGFTEFLGMAPLGEAVEMTYAGRADDDYGRERWRLNAAPGISYLFSPGNWADRAAAAEAIGGIRPGTRLRVAVDRQTGLLELLPYPDGRLGDEVNVYWSLAFTGATDLTAATENGEILTDVPSPPGIRLSPRLPVRIPVDGLTPADTFFELEQWDEYEQRRGRVRGARLGSFDVTGWEKQTPERFRELQDIRDGDHIQLGRLIRLNSDGGMSDACARDGVALKVDTTSLTLAPLGKSARFQLRDLARNRNAIIRIRHNTGRTQEAIPLSGREFALALAAAGEPVEVPDGQRVMNGVVMRHLKTRDVQHSRQYWGLWLQVGDRIRYAEIPGSAFCVPPRWPGLGDLVTAELSRNGAGWTFRAEGREIRAYATYRTVDIDSIPVRRRKTVGYEVDGWRVVQDVERAVLAFARPQASTRRSFERELAGAAVRLVGNPFGPRGSMQRAVVEFSDGSVVSGVTSAYDADRLAASVRDVRIGFTEIGDGAVLIDRNIDCELQPRAQAQGITPAEIDRFLQDEQRHQAMVLDGILVPDGIRFGSAVRLPDGSYARIVPRPEGDDPWIAPDEGDDERDKADPSARAILVRDGAGYRASCRLAPPLSLDDFESVLGTGQGRGSARRATPGRFSYVGTSAGDDGGTFHIFEWGHGKTVQVPDGRLSRRTADGGTFSLFHGDRVIAVTVEKGKDGLAMAIDPSDVRLGLPGRLYKEADVGVVHQITVEILPESGNVRVRSVLTGRRDYDRRRSGQASHKAIRAQLSKKSVRRLLADVPAGSTGPVTRDILARLDRKLFNNHSDGQGRNLGFIYIPAEADPAGKSPAAGKTLEEDETLREGDRLLLISGHIGQTGDGNDVYMDFVPPGEPGSDTPSLKVQVYRRQYSYREDVLLRLYEAQQRKQAVEAQVMTVTLLGPPKRAGMPWRGATRQSPLRSRAQLATFLATQRARTALATVGETTRGRRCLEVEPGAVFETGGVGLPASAEPGTVIRVTLRTNRRDIDAELAVPSDLSYLPAGTPGRTAVVMPKSTLLRHGALELLTPDRTTRDYTLAGLPGIEAQAASAVSRELLECPHPKTALATRSGTRVTITPPAESAPVGRVVAEPGNAAAVLVPLPGRHAPAVSIDWAQLSFADTDLYRIADATRRTSFRYGDSLTGHWTTAEDRAPALQRTSLAAPTGADEVAFASVRDGIPVLRHANSDLRRFGFPAVHIMEVLARASKPRDKEFTVAAVAYDPQDRRTARGLWLEIRPGHVAELVGAMLTDQSGHSISRLTWEHFAPGDRIVLDAERADPRSLASIRLHGWRPGPRAAFALSRPGDRMLLPVTAVSEVSGSVSLGAGRSRLAYPASAETRAAFPIGSVVWLDGENHLTSAGPPQEDDTVLLGSTGGRLFVHGLPDAQVHLAQHGWTDSWVRDLLDDPRTRDNLMELLGQALPVTVEEAQPAHVIVSRRRQPAGTMRPGSLVWARFLGPVDIGDEQHLLLDSGGCLLAVRPEILVPGAPSKTGARIGVRDARTWLHVDDKGRLRGGRPLPGDRPNEVLVVAKQGLDLGGGLSGLVCQETETAAFRWLPAARAAWCDVPAKDLVPHMIGREFRASVEDDGTLSLVGTTGARNLYSSLALGATHRVEYLGQTAGARSQALARVHLSEMIVGIERLDSVQVTPGTALLAEVAQHRQGREPTVVVVPQGKRRIVMDLPPTVVTAMRRLAAWNPEYDGPARLRELQRFERYKDMLAAREVSDPRPDVATALIFAAARQADQDSEASGISAAQLITDWRNKQENAAETDLAPALAACILMDQLGRSIGDPQRAREAVRYLNEVGRLATRSMHVESLADDWLGQPDRWSSRGQWERLRRVLGKAEVSADDPRELFDDGPIHDFARSVLQRPDATMSASNAAPWASTLAPIARSLLAAVGALDSGDDWLRDAPILASVANLGRSLTPPAGDDAAQPSLLGYQRQLLRDLFLQVTRSGSPYVMLPAD